MSSLVVGSIALDDVRTPFGKAQDALGGTAVYYSIAASTFTDVQLVGVIGDDFPQEGVDLLRGRNVDLAGLQRRHGETFRWVGEYDFDMNIAHTLDTRLNVFETFHPSIPDHYRDASIVFLGNIDPELQLDVLRQVKKPKLTALDTMNFWIERKREQLTEVIKNVDAVLINEAELREYAGKYNVLQAAQCLQQLGPRIVVVKRGEYGAMLFNDNDLFIVPAFPTYEVRDTTGAGDSFAGGFLGYLDSCSTIDGSRLREATVLGTILASFAVEDFSVYGLVRADSPSIEERYARLTDISRIFPTVSLPERHLVIEGV
ncbi:MAG TPA: PfkB family carbohydrate kinase [Chloroflexota bacterium]